MPVFILFISLIIASAVGIVLSSFYSINGVTPEWIHRIFLSIIGAGVIASAITKEQLCKLCSFISLKKIDICKCQHA